MNSARPRALPLEMGVKLPHQIIYIWSVEHLFLTRLYKLRNYDMEVKTVLHSGLASQASYADNLVSGLSGNALAQHITENLFSGGLTASQAESFADQLLVVYQSQSSPTGFS